MERDQIIQSLVAESLHQILEQKRSNWLLRVLEHGFTGYSNLDDEALLREAQRYGISTTGPLQADEFNSDDHSTSECADAVEFERELEDFHDYADNEESLHVDD